MRKPVGPVGPGLVAVVALVALSLAARTGHAQAPSFTAEVDRPQVAVGDTFTYEVTLNVGNEAVDDFHPPNFGSLRVMSAPRGPNRSTQMQIGGGGTFVQNGFTWQYILAGQQKGSVSIGPARVRVGGREMKCNTVNVRVVDAGAAPPAAQRQRQRSRSPFAGIPGFGFDPDPAPEPEPAPEPAAGGGHAPPLSSAPAPTFARVVADKPHAIVGEQVTVTWYLYFLQRADKYETITEAHTDGFWSEDITPSGGRGQMVISNEQVGGRTYQVATLSRKALFPLQTGKLTITPLEGEIAQVDFFGSTLRRQRVKTEPLSIDVGPVPREGQPSDFDAANVGRFTVAGHVDRATVGVGEAVTFTLEIKGQGNIRNVRAPALPPLDGWKSYPPKSNVVLDGGEIVAGTKSLEYLLLPERPGTTMLTSLTLPYYDPQGKAYGVAKSDPIRLEVTGDATVHAGAAPVAAATGPGVGHGAGAENVITAEIRPIRAQAGLRRDLGATFYRSSAFTGILVVPPVGLVLTMLIGSLRERFGGDTQRTRRRRLRQLVRKRLAAAERHRDANQTSAFHIEIDRVLRDLLSARLGQVVAGLRRDELLALLSARGMPADLTDRVLAELEECDMARFAPGSGGVGQERMTTALNRAAELIEAIEKAPLRAEASA